MDLLGVKLGFGFSAGLFDYVLNYGLATRPLMLLPVGIVYFGIYYFTFSWCITRFNLATPGREPAEMISAARMPSGDRGAQFAAALGGSANLKSVDACTTRLRLRLADPTMVDELALRALGAKGIVRPGGDSVQVVLGPMADQVASEIRSAGTVSGPALVSVEPADIADLLRPAGISSVEVRGSRLLVGLDDPSLISAPDLDRSGARGWVMVARGIQIIIGPGAEAAAEALSAAAAKA
jgi:PTS system N-acetylglucosamine-specific IIC component